MTREQVEAAKARAETWYINGSLDQESIALCSALLAARDREERYRALLRRITDSKWLPTYLHDETLTLLAEHEGAK